MIELPEAAVIAHQLADLVIGKRIACAVASTTPHRFAWYTGDPATYNDRLAGKTINGASSVGLYVQLEAGDFLVATSAPVRYHAAGEKRPSQHQLLIEFDDGTAISARAAMWGGFLCHPAGEKGETIDYAAAAIKPSPLTDAFDRSYFDSLFDESTPKLSAKAFLATEQRIPGLGNGVLQDILWTARIHPKRRMGSLATLDIDRMFDTAKSLLAQMAAEGGRDTELDLFGRPGGYATLLCSKTAGRPCPECGGPIRKEAFLGGSVYYCPTCQPI